MKELVKVAALPMHLLTLKTASCTSFFLLPICSGAVLYDETHGALWFRT